jgi:hypothetical protein
MQIDSSNPNKEAAIIDEDVDSEDARSVGNAKGLMISTKHDQELQTKRSKKERKAAKKSSMENTARSFISPEQTQHTARQREDKYEY